MQNVAAAVSKDEGDSLNLPSNLKRGALQFFHSATRPFLGVIPPF